MTEVLFFLEERFGADFSRSAFSQSDVDSVESILDLIARLEDPRPSSKQFPPRREGFNSTLVWLLSALLAAFVWWSFRKP